MKSLNQCKTRTEKIVFWATLPPRAACVCLFYVMRAGMVACLFCAMGYGDARRAWRDTR